MAKLYQVYTRYKENDKNAITAFVLIQATTLDEAKKEQLRWSSP